MLRYQYSRDKDFTQDTPFFRLQTSVLQFFSVFPPQNQSPLPTPHSLPVPPRVDPYRWPQLSALAFWAQSSPTNGTPSAAQGAGGEKGSGTSSPQLPTTHWRPPPFLAIVQPKLIPKGTSPILRTLPQGSRHRFPNQPWASVGLSHRLLSGTENNFF